MPNKSVATPLKEHMNTQSQNEPPAIEKVAYQPPEIVDYGTIETLTQAGFSFKPGNIFDADPSSAGCLGLDC